MYRCVDCGSDKVYEIEFRTDYTNARYINALNDEYEDLDNDDLPYRLDGYYCHNCQSLCSVKEDSSKEIKEVVQESLRNLECSSKGDKRFSSFYAIVDIYGKKQSIENHYQLCKRFGDFIPRTWKDVKGKIPTHIEVNGVKLSVEYLSSWYKLLWYVYLKSNPKLVEYASGFDTFSDMYRGNSINCQADVIRQYVKEGEMSIFHDFKDLITVLKMGAMQ